MQFKSLMNMSVRCRFSICNCPTVASWHGTWYQVTGAIVNKLPVYYVVGLYNLYQS